MATTATTTSTITTATTTTSSKKLFDVFIEKLFKYDATIGQMVTKKGGIPFINTPLNRVNIMDAINGIPYDDCISILDDIYTIIKECSEIISAAAKESFVEKDFKYFTQIGFVSPTINLIWNSFSEEEKLALLVLMKIINDDCYIDAQIYNFHGDSCGLCTIVDSHDII